MKRLRLNSITTLAAALCWLTPLFLLTGCGRGNDAPGGWLMSPFNSLFFAVFAAFLLLLTVASLLLRGQPEKARRTVLISACALTLVGFFVYKYALSLDAEYNLITAEMGGFNWWGELPLQLCNISMILIPVSVIKKSRPLMCFCFFVGPLAAFMSMVMPGNGFDGYSLLLPRMLGYYGTHFMIVIEGWALYTFGLYHPRFADLPKAILSSVLLALAIFGVNMLLRLSGLHSKANYFLTVETEGNPVMELFHSWLPLPFVYVLPCTGILGAYMALVTAVLTWVERLRSRRTPTR